MWTDHGWYWVSDYSWGWAVFHYGRWRLEPHHGWIWLPDRVWGPSWVVWRTGGDYCGWAPLPPGAVYDTVAGRFSFHGRHVEVGFDFGLGWNLFSFCYVREMGQSLRQHFRGEPEIHAIYNRTTVINNYAVKKTVGGGETRVQILNRGIEPARVTAAKGRNFETVKIQDLPTPSSARGHEHYDARQKTMEVYRPKFGGHK